MILCNQSGTIYRLKFTCDMMRHMVRLKPIGISHTVRINQPGGRDSSYSKLNSNLKEDLEPRHEGAYLGEVDAGDEALVNGEPGLIVVG